MQPQSYSCEIACSSLEPVKNTQMIVVTGGPGAGKTALLELMRKTLCQHVAVLPEAASILFGGGFWRVQSPTAKMAAQRAIYHIQSELQTLATEEKKWFLALCDRGTLDGLAYWPGPPSEYCKQLNTSIAEEYSRYTAVIHLSSPDQTKGYNHINPLRIETAEQALLIDGKIHEVWKNHPNYNRIESTTDFMEKVERATLLIDAFLPEQCRAQLHWRSNDTK